MFEASLGGEDDLADFDHLQIVAVNAIKDRFKNIHVPVKAGISEVVATFIARDPAESDYQLEASCPAKASGRAADARPRRGRALPPTGISVETRSRERIFVCRPASTADELPCAEQDLEPARASRVPARAHGNRNRATLGFLPGRSRLGRIRDGHPEGLARDLSSTNFLYRGEPAAPRMASSPAQAYPISDLELASRLSFFLWSQGPDSELLDSPRRSS